MSIRLFVKMHSKSARHMCIPVPNITRYPVATYRITPVSHLKEVYKHFKEGIGSGFTYKGLMKNWSAIPVVILTLGAFIFVPVAAYYITVTRPELRFHRSMKTLAERMDLDNAPYLKFMKVVGPPTNNVPDVAELYREMETAALEKQDDDGEDEEE